MTASLGNVAARAALNARLPIGMQGRVRDPQSPVT